jgi:hypothetical protein
MCVCIEKGRKEERKEKKGGGGGRYGRLMGCGIAGFVTAEKRGETKLNRHDALSTHPRTQQHKNNQYKAILHSQRKRIRLGIQMKINDGWSAQAAQYNNVSTAINSAVVIY